MSLPATITIKQIRGDHKETVTIPVAEFTALYTRVDTKLRDMAKFYSITVPGVREAAAKIGLPNKANNWKFKPKYSDVKFGEAELRQLLVTENLSYPKTAARLGVTDYYVRR